MRFDGRPAPRATPGPGHTARNNAALGVEAVLDTVLDAVLMSDAAGRIVFANREIERVFGYLPSELVGQAVEVLVPTELRAGHHDLRAGYAASPVPRRMGEQLHLFAVRKDGTRFPAEISLAPITTPAGTYVTALVRDVTVRQQLLRSEHHLALSQRVARMASWEQDFTTGEVQWSREMYPLLGIEPDTVTPSPEAFYTRVHPDDLPIMLAEAQRALVEGGRMSAQVRLTPAARTPGHPPDGRIRTVMVLGVVDLDPSGRAVHGVGTIRDVTETVLLQQRLRAADERFQLAFDRAPIGMLLVSARPDLEGRIIKVNAALCAVLGQEEHQLLGGYAREVIQIDDPPAAGLRDQLRSGKISTIQGERRITRGDGERRWVAITASLVRDDHGEPDYYFISQVLDVTERRADRIAAQRRVERERRIVGVLQGDLLPDVPRWVGPVQTATRYQPAGSGETVGGDWHDVFALPDGRIGLVVGDVAGHGIESAATMNRLRYAVRMLACTGAGPDDVMTALNRAVFAAVDANPETEMVTIVHAQLDPVTGALAYSSAGHPPLLTVSTTDPAPAHRARLLVMTGDPPIGVMPAQRYVRREVTLEAGSVLVGYTDGLIERRGQNIDDSLRTLLTGLDALPATALAELESLADDILRLAPPGLRTDDTAVIVLAVPQTAPP